jgi:hypothetical protein
MWACHIDEASWGRSACGRRLQLFLEGGEEEVYSIQRQVRGDVQVTLSAARVDVGTFRL